MHKKEVCFGEKYCSVDGANQHGESKADNGWYYRRNQRNQR